METIVFITPSLKTGGGNRVFFELANCLVLKYNVIIILPNNNLEGNSFFIHERIKINKIGKYSGNRLKKIGNIIKVYFYINKYHHEDKSIISDPIMCLFLLLIRNKKNLYRFIQADDYSIFDDKYLLKNSVFLFFYKKFCVYSYMMKVNYIFNSIFTYQKFSFYSHRNNIDTKIVYPAINHSIFYDRCLDIRSYEFNICLVGRKHPWKGLQTFIDMFVDLDSETKNMINNIFIISHDDLSNFDIKFCTLIKPHSDEEIAEIYNKSRVFISTSWWEGFGLPGLEAMACGCAVITSDSGGVKEYADDTNSLFFIPKSSHELRITLIKLLNDRKLVFFLSERGKASANKFTWEKSSSQLESILFGIYRF
jgi:glycosyltransferase involved in cell wall biosynthesis